MGVWMQSRFLIVHDGCGRQEAARALTRELVLQTRQFGVLVGTAQADGRLRVRYKVLYLW
jgi:hypothetical protein